VLICQARYAGLMPVRASDSIDCPGTLEATIRYEDRLLYGRILGASDIPPTLDWYHSRGR